MKFDIYPLLNEGLNKSPSKNPDDIQFGNPLNIFSIITRNTTKNKQRRGNKCLDEKNNNDSAKW